MGHIWLRFCRGFNPCCGPDRGPAGSGVRGAKIRANQGGTSRVLAPRARGLCAGVTATMTAAFFPLAGVFMAMALTWLIMMTVAQTNIGSALAQSAMNIAASAWGAVESIGRTMNRAIRAIDPVQAVVFTGFGVAICLLVSCCCFGGAPKINKNTDSFPIDSFTMDNGTCEEMDSIPAAKPIPTPPLNTADQDGIHMPVKPIVGDEDCGMIDCDMIESDEPLEQVVIDALDPDVVVEIIGEALDVFCTDEAAEALLHLDLSDRLRGDGDLGFDWRRHEGWKRKAVSASGGFVYTNLETGAQYDDEEAAQRAFDGDTTAKPSRMVQVDAPAPKRARVAERESEGTAAAQQVRTAACCPRLCRF